jgi:predicted nuclease with TOPRIM domain
MHRRFERSPGMAYDYSRLLTKLEELKGEADHRCLGGFQTQDKAFAGEMAELIRDMIEFMDGVDEMLLGMEQEFTDELGQRDNEINDQEDTISRLNDELSALEDDITRSNNLKRLLRDILIDD